MKPPKRKKKKKGKEKDNTEESQEPQNPVLAERKKKFPGLSLPDDSERVKGLLKLEPEEEEELRKKEVEQKAEDPSVVSQALDEVSARLSYPSIPNFSGFSLFSSQ